MDYTLREVIDLLDREPLLSRYLKQCPLEVLRCMRVERYAPDEFYLKQGGHYHQFYFIANGTLEIFVESRQGKKHRQALYEKGSYFGEMELFDQLPYISSVRALTEVELLVVPRNAFLHWLQVDHLFAVQMLRAVCSDAYNMCLAMENNILYTLKQRVCRYLLEAASDAGGRRGSGTVEMGSEQLSETMAVTQRSINRVLKDLKEKEIIRVAKNRITVLDFAALDEESNVE